jgi:hypothetical protein
MLELPVLCSGVCSGSVVLSVSADRRKGRPHEKSSRQARFSACAA